MAFLPDLPPVPIRGPRALPLLGPTGNFFRFFGDPVGSVMRLRREYGDLVALSDRSPAMICAFGPEHNRAVLTSPGVFEHNTRMLFKLPDDCSVLRLNNGLVMMNGDKHRRQRRMMMPAFTRATIDGYRDDVVAVAERSLREIAPGRELDAAEVMMTLALRVAMKCFFGLDVGDGAEELGHLGRDHLDGLTSPAAMLAPFDLPGLPYAKLLRQSDKLEQRLLALIARRRAQPGGRDVLSLMIHAHDEDGSSFTDTELTGQSSLLYLAGHETTAYTLGWTLLLLSQHPRVHASLVEELKSKLHGDAPTAAQLAELPVLDHVVKESMRLLPATPVTFMRFTSAETPLGPYTLPGGSGVMVSPLVTHQMPELYADPRSFRPERWEKLTPSLYEYLPFGAGPRMCLGAGFAAMAIRVLVAMLVQKARFELKPAARISRAFRGITMGPKHGIPMRVQKQDGTFPAPGGVRGDLRELVNLPS